MKSVHNKRYEHQCYLCTFSSKTTLRLKGHMENFHKNLKIDILCKWCSFRGNEVKDIEDHTQVIHSDVAEQHGCEQCQFSTYHMPTLDAHFASVHQRNNCELCPFKGTTRRSISDHMRIKHETVIERQHRCYLCTLTTDNKEYLLQYVALQTVVEVPCSINDRSFCYRAWLCCCNGK